ncbi:MAG: autotransporter domain-containing protein, partial [Planctomycetota bacterium]
DNVFQTDQQLSINGAAELELRGTDQTIGSLTGGGDIDLGNDSASVFTIGADDENANFTGEIFGDGGLVKIGDGDQNLSGELEYLGDTRVQDGELIISGTLTESNVFVENGGTLVLSDSSPNSGDDNVENDVFVEDGGILYGSGSIGNDLENAGLIDFEEGNNNRLVIDGDYTQTNDGEFLVQVGANGSSGALEVDGVATLDGTLEIVSDDDEDQFNPSTEYLLLTAEGGIVGEWSNIEEDFAFLDATVVYEERDDNDGDGDEARLTLSRNDLDFIDTAETTNQAAVSGALSRVVGTAEDELATVIGIVETLNGDGSRDAYDSLSGAQLATVQSTALVSLQRQHNLLADRAQFIAFDSGIAEAADTAAAWAPNRLEYTSAMHPSVEMFRNQNATEEPVEAPKPDLWSNASPWGRIYSGDNGFDGEDGSGVELDLEGVVLGVDWFGNGTPWAAGLALGFETSDYVYDDLSGDGDNQTLFISGYAKRELGDYHLTGIATLAYGDNESTRLVDVGGSIGIAESDFDSFSLALSVEASRPYIFDYDRDLERPRAVVEPFVRASYAGTFQSSYEEDLLGTAGLDVDSNYLDSFRVYAGARGEWVVDTLFPLEFIFQGRAMVGAALIDEQSNLDVAFVDTPGSGFTVEGAEASTVFGVVGVGLAMPLGERSHAFLNYDEEIGDEGSGSLISFGLRIVF